MLTLPVPRQPSAGARQPRIKYKLKSLSQSAEAVKKQMLNTNKCDYLLCK